MPWDGLPDARALTARAFAAGIASPPTRTVTQWADAERILGPEESPLTGPWRTTRTPYLREVMDALSLSHPAEYVTFKASSQVAKTNTFLNFAGQIASETPATVLWVTPSIDEARAFNREKLEPMIANSPVVGRAVKQLVSRDETGSTTMVKRFPGGSIELTGANSSKGLQMRTKRIVVLDEVSEFPFDVDGRGDPVAMAEARAQVWFGRGAKIAAASTPGLKGQCRISARWEKGSQGRYHLPCPDCGARQALKMTNLRWPQGEPEKAEYHCDACGAAIEHKHKTQMLADGIWVHERPEMVWSHPSFTINALYSPFVTWAMVARKRDETRDDPLLDKVFVQQWEGEPYEPRYDVPSQELLWQQRESWPVKRIPPWVLFVVTTVDVQGDRLEWGTWGFDRHMGQSWIDGGVLPGDPNLDPVWLELDKVLDKTWPDAWGREWKAVSFGIDSGYLPQRVYRYARRHAHRDTPRVLALDGRPKWGEPPIGTPSTKDVDYNGRKIGAVQLWPVGTWDLKTELAAALRLTEMGPDETGARRKGAMRFPQALDLAFFEQLTAEACVEVGTRAGFMRREWRKVRQRNEQWDIAVYARALARHETAQFAEETWDQLVADRQGKPQDAQGDLVEWASALVRPASAAPAPSSPEQPAAAPATETQPIPTPEESFFDGAEDYWG